MAQPPQPEGSGKSAGRKEGCDGRGFGPSRRIPCEQVTRLPMAQPSQRQPKRRGVEMQKPAGREARGLSLSAGMAPEPRGPAVRCPSPHRPGRPPGSGTGSSRSAPRARPERRWRHRASCTPGRRARAPAQPAAGPSPSFWRPVVLNERVPDLIGAAKLAKPPHGHRQTGQLASVPPERNCPNFGSFPAPRR